MRSPLLTNSGAVTLALAMCGAVCGPAQEGALRDEDIAFVEVVGPTQPVFRQQRIVLRVRVGVARTCLETNMLQLFHRKLDVPVQLDVPWLTNLPGTAGAKLSPEGSSPEAPSAGRRLSFVLNGDVTRARRLKDERRGGREFTVLQLERSYFPMQPGTVVVPEVQLRFAFATRFQDDFIHGRVPADRRDVRLVSKPLAIVVEALPSAGRPSGFTGAVGSFSIRTSLDKREARVGERLRLVLAIEGEGNTELFRAPGLEELEGFHVFGKIEARSPVVRTVTYDVAPLTDAVSAFPPVAFAFFDPVAKIYRTARSEAIPLLSRSGPTMVDPGGRHRVPESSSRDIRDLKNRTQVTTLAPRGGAAWWLLPVIVTLTWFAAFGLRAFLRVHRRRRGDLDRHRRLGAAAAFRADLAGGNAADALAEYLAAWLGCAATAVITHDLHHKLRDAGVADELAGRADRILHTLVAARYGGAAGATSDAAVRSLVEELETAFEAAGRG